MLRSKGIDSPVFAYYYKNLKNLGVSVYSKSYPAPTQALGGV